MCVCVREGKIKGKHLELKVLRFMIVLVSEGVHSIGLGQPSRKLSPADELYFWCREFHCTGGAKFS